MKLYKYIPAICFVSLLGYHTSSAQERIITLTEAVNLGLENNYGVKIAKINTEIAGNNNTYGNAGYYPQVRLEIDQNNNLANTQQLFLDNRENNIRGAYSNNFQTRLVTDWVFFDGFRMQSAKKRLEETYTLTELNRQAQMEQTVADVVNAYYAIVQQQKILDLTKESLRLSQERLDLARSKEEIGSAAGVSTLQSTIDYNNDSLTLLNQIIQLEILENQLAIALLLKDGEQIAIDTSITWPTLPPYADLKASFLTQNIQLKQARSQIRLNEHIEKEVGSMQYPTLALNGGLNLNISRSQAGFLLQNLGYGPFLGISLRQNIIDGNNVKREKANARLNTEIFKIQLEESLTLQTRQLDMLMNQHEALDEVLEVQSSNINFTKQSLDIAIQRYRLAAITDIEFREIQLLNIAAANQLYQTELLKRQLEVEILRISGNLMEN